jgi:MATE family multidrug resistance protein
METAKVASNQTPVAPRAGGEHPTWDDLRDLVRFAAPVVFVQVGLMLMGVVDTIVLGRRSADALAAGALGNLYFMTVAMFGMGVLFALDAVVAQAVGANDQKGVARGVQRGLVLAALLAVPSTIALWFARPALMALGEPAAVIPLADGYVKACIPGMLPFLAFVVLRQSLQAMGGMRPLVIAIVVSNLLNAVLSWALVFGRLGLPAWGAVGAGVATTASRWVLFLLLVGAGARELRPVLLPWRRDALARGPLLRLVRLGMPVGFQFVLEVGVFSLIGLLMGRLGTLPLAGHQVALTLASLTFMIPLGVSVSAAVLVGRAVGRRDPNGARRAARLSLLVSGSFMALSAATMLTVPRLVASLYTNDPAVLASAAMLIPIAGVFQVFDGLQITAGGVLRGLGDTRAPFLANLVGYWLLGFPASWLLAFRWGQGPRGLWWGFVVGLGTVAIFLVARVRLRLRRIPPPLAIDSAGGPGLGQPEPYAVAEHAAG